MMKRLWFRLAVLTVLGMPAVTLAYGAQSGQSTTIPKGETKTGTYFAAGQSVTVDGDIDGDLICAGQTVQVNGAVHGDVICAGQSVTVNGPVDGSVRLFGQTLNVNGTVGRNVTVAGQVFNLGGNAAVSGDLGVASQSATISGTVTKTVYGAMSNLMIDNRVGSVEARVANDLALGGNSHIDGDLTYYSNNTSNVDSSKVGGQVQHQGLPMEPRVPEQRNRLGAAGMIISWILYWLAAALVVGLAFVWLAPRMVQHVSKTMLEQPGMSLLWGVVAAILGPVVFILLMVTIIGIPVALLLFGFWVLALVTSGVFAGVAAGVWITQRTGWQKHSLWAAAVLGIIATVIVFNIPILGWLLALVATWWAVGGMILSARLTKAT